jgi:hypothetical protein
MRLARWATIPEAESYARVRHGVLRSAVARGEVEGYKRPGVRGARVDLDTVDEWIRRTWQPAVTTPGA